MDQLIIIPIASICVISMLCQLFAWWTRVPSILYLLVSGVLIGPVVGYLHPDQLFGDLLFPLVSLAVAIILFEASLTLNFKKIREQQRHILQFIAGGSIITFVGISLSVYYIFATELTIAFLIGAMLTVTGPTVIMPMLRSIRPTTNVANISKWEGIILDPFGAILTVLVFDFIMRGQSNDVIMHSVLFFLKMTASGALLGFVFGFLLSEVLLRHLVPKFLVNMMVLNFVLIAFVTANYFYHETGLLAVTIAGLTLANRSDLDLRDILEFKETISTILLSSLFIVLAARVNLATLYPLLLPSLLLFAVMLFLIRPLKVAVTTTGSGLTMAEKIVLVWIAPRGIVAAAIASLFEFKLMALGYDVGYITPIVFLVIVWSVLLPSLSGRYLANKLDACLPDPDGILIIGANTLARHIAEVLKSHGMDVLIADTNWYEISLARMGGIKTYYGNPMSEYAEENIAISNIGILLAITPNTELSVLASVHFKHDIEQQDIYYIQTEHEKNAAEKNVIAKQHLGKKLFADNATYEYLIEMLWSGATIKSTVLSDKFTYDDYLAYQNGNCIPLLAFDAKEKLKIFAVDGEVKPGTGWTIISLMAKDTAQELQEQLTSA